MKELKQMKIRTIIPLLWIGTAGIISMIISDWIIFWVAIIFSSGWYVNWIFSYRLIKSATRR